jgi:hypothetical protein
MSKKRLGRTPACAWRTLGWLCLVALLAAGCGNSSSPPAPPRPSMLKKRMKVGWWTRKP